MGAKGTDGACDTRSQPSNGTGEGNTTTSLRGSTPSTPISQPAFSSSYPDPASIIDTMQPDSNGPVSTLPGSLGLSRGPSPSSPATGQPSPPPPTPEQPSLPSPTPEQPSNLSSPSIDSTPSPEISPQPIPSAPSPSTTAPISSVVLLSVELEAEAAAGNITGRGLTGHKEGQPRLGRRQSDFPGTPDPGMSSGFIGNNTIYNPGNCTEANLFVQGGGQLRTSGRPLSVDPGVDYINVADFPGGSITTRFTVVCGILVWDNAAFYNGTAAYCQVAEGTVYATFSQTGAPFNCTPVNLVVYTCRYLQHKCINYPRYAS